MRWVKLAVISSILAYMGITGLVFAGQRYLLFSPSDGRELAAANWQAIENTDRFFIHTSDGEKLSAWYVAPQSGQPVFLFFHGKGGKIHIKKWRWRRIIKQGAGILTLSYRGYPGSTGTPSELGLHEDAKAAYAWLRTKHPPEQIVIHGLSLGTGVAVALAENVKARALILEAPFSAAVDIAGERYPFLPVTWLMSDPFLSRERIGNVAMPVLIAHGTKDTVIPYHHAKRLFQRAKEPKKLVTMPGSDHNTLVRDGLYPHIWRFLNAQQTQQP